MSLFAKFDCRGETSRLLLRCVAQGNRSTALPSLLSPGKFNSRRTCESAAELISQTGKRHSVTIGLSGDPGDQEADARERRGHVKSRRRIATDDVATDAQPIRRQVRIADPCLQIPSNRESGGDDWSRRRQVEEVAASTFVSFCFCSSCVLKFVLLIFR